MDCIKSKIMKILFCVSFLPITVIVIMSIYYSIAGHAYYDWFEPDKISYIAYGLEEFIDSVAYYGGYFTLHIPILPISVFYQIFYIAVIRKKKNEL